MGLNCLPIEPATDSADLNINIENVVASATLNQKIDLLPIMKVFMNVEYKPKRFPGLVFRLKKLKTATLIFHSGKMVCTGAKSEKTAKSAIRKVVRELKNGGIVILNKPDITVQNIVASANLQRKVDLEEASDLLDNVMYEPEQFPGLVYRLDHPKTATLLFRSGKANCTGAKNVEDVRKTVDLIADKLKKLGVDVYKDLKIVIQNIVAISDLGTELNLNEVAMGLGLENVEYEPEQFPGLVYRIREPKVAMLLFGSGKIVCTGARQTEDVSLAVDKLSAELSSLDLIRK